MGSNKEVDAYVHETLISANYRDVERVRQDVLEVIAQYPGLQPQRDTYIYKDGTEQLLLKLTGTLPVKYKGNVYNIPLDMWLLTTYPYNAPMVLLCPTPEMRIKVSQSVMPDGRVKLPYMQEWNHNSSELLLLIQVLIITFQEEPPVYAVQLSPPYPLSPYNSYLHSEQNFAQAQAQANASAGGLSSERFELLQNAAGRVLRRLHQLYGASCVEQWNYEQLQRGSEKLTRLSDRLKTEKDQLLETVEISEKELIDLSSNLIAHEADVEDREANIEDAIVAPRPLFRQIVETHTEESAIQDAIYFVSEGLRAGRMELDQFEKTIRKLARKQFMLRLLLVQCREKAGLK